MGRQLNHRTPQLLGYPFHVPRTPSSKRLPRRYAISNHGQVTLSTPPEALSSTPGPIKFSLDANLVEGSSLRESLGCGVRSHQARRFALSFAVRQ